MRTRWVLFIVFAIHMTTFFAKAEEVVAAAQASASATDSSAKSSNGEDTALTNTQLPESEIPLNIDKPKKAESESGSLFRALFGIAIIGTLATAGYIFIRKYSVKNAKNPHTKIQVLTQHHLGPKKSLAIVRVAGESILIGVTDQNISMLKSLSLLDEDIPEEVPATFDTVLKNSKTKNLQIDDEDFAFSGIKDIVTSRLKGMRNLD